jgi:hypothetical protein
LGIDFGSHNFTADSGRYLRFEANFRLAKLLRILSVMIGLSGSLNYIKSLVFKLFKKAPGNT